MPNPGLSPFGTMNDTLCTFHPSDTRWSSMSSIGNPMTANPLTLSASLPRQSIGQTFGPQVSLGGLDNISVTLANNMAIQNGGASIYNSGYGMTSSSCASPLSGGSSSPPSLQASQMTCGMQDLGDTWRGTSIASLRRKALEHTATLTGFR